MLKFEHLNEGERYRACLLELYSFRIEYVRNRGSRDEKFVHLLESERRRAAEWSLQTKRHLNALIKWRNQCIAEWQEFLPINEFDDLKMRLLDQGLLRAGELPSSGDEEMKKILKRKKINSRSEFAELERYAERLFETGDVPTLKQVNLLLADFLKEAK